MKPIRALTLVCALLALAVAAAEPRAQLTGGAIAADVTVQGAKHPHYRLAAGKLMALRIEGPAALRLEMRVEGALPATLTVALTLDGKIAARAPISTELEPEATSDLDLPVSRAFAIAVSVPAGKHTAALLWPKGMPKDALVAVRGVQVSAPEEYVLPAPSAPELPLPSASAVETKPPPLLAPTVAPSVPPLPLPAAEAAVPKPLPPPSPETAAAPGPLPPPSPETAAAPEPSLATVAAAQAPQLTTVEASAAGEATKPLAATVPPAMGPAARTRERLPPESAPWSVTLLAGAERSSEQFTEAEALAHLGVEATRTIWMTGLAVFQFDWRNSRQTYVLGQPGVGPAKVDEQRYDTMLAVGYDFGPLFDTPRLLLAPVVGVKYVRLQNSAFPADLFGVDLMGRARYALSAAVGVHANVGWMYNLIHSSRFSAIGTPFSQFGVRAGFDFPLPAGYALALDYQGDILSFDYSTRVAHGATAGFGKSF